MQELHRLDVSFAKTTPERATQWSPTRRSHTHARPLDDDPPPVSAVDGYAAAPLAPRRSGTRPSTATRADSPEIPAFSTAGAVNDFSAPRAGTGTGTSLSRHLTSSFGARPATSPAAAGVSEFGALVPSTPTPPPRPAKHPRRPSAAVAPRGGSPATTPLIPPLEPMPSISMDIVTSDDPEREPRPRAVRTVSNASTMRERRARRRSSSLGAPSAGGGGASPVTFRELGASPARARSEQEKARMWDDLLARSDRAGGTLRVGGEELPSDSLRLSVYSEV
jgi:hypothetical protein